MRGKVFGLYSTVKTRYDFLSSLKNIEETIGTPSRYLKVEEAIRFNLNYLIFSPPKDDLKDIALMVEHPELRRTKASRTIIPVKPMFLPIPLKVLKMPREQGIQEIAKIVNKCIKKDVLKIATPELKKYDFCSEFWDQYLVIFDSHLVSRCISQDIDSTYLNRLKTPEIRKIQ